MTVRYFDTLPSTNTYLRENAGVTSDMTLIVAGDQTAGRGQRGNSWESEPFSNLTCSLFFHPKDILPREQFAISEAVALAVVETLAQFNIKALIKWPNDIYCSDGKIAGILIEHAVSGTTIEHTIAGIGINVNQTAFRSDAPNPVSMAQIAGKSHDLREVTETLTAALEKYLLPISSEEGRGRLHSDYMSRLWRGPAPDGSLRYFPFRLKRTVNDREGLQEGSVFSAAIADILPTGHIVLRPDTSFHPDIQSLPPFAFKEIEFILRAGR